jgi:hypothetical protein
MWKISLGENCEIQTEYPSSAQRLCASKPDQRSQAAAIPTRPIATAKRICDLRWETVSHGRSSIEADFDAETSSVRLL